MSSKVIINAARNEEQFLGIHSCYWKKDFCRQKSEQSKIRILRLLNNIVSEGESE
jgi:hypothetical protein